MRNIFINSLVTLSIFLLTMKPDLSYSQTKANNTGLNKIYTPKLENLYNVCDTCADENVLIYDFKCKHFFFNDAWVQNLNQLSVPANKEFKVRIININRYMYDVEFIADDITFGSEQPALFKQLFLGDGTFATGLIERISQADKVVEPAAADGTDSSKGEKLKAAIENFLTIYYSLMDNSIKAFNYCSHEVDCCKKDRNSFSTLAKSLLKLKLIYQKYNEEVGHTLITLQKKIEAEQKVFDDCKKKKERLEEDLKDERTEAGRRRIRAEIDKLNCSEQTLIQLKGEKTITENLKVDMDKLWTNISKITDEDLMKLILFDNNLVADHFSYTSPPIYPKGNLLSIGLKVSPTDSSLIKKWSIMPLYNDSLGLDVFVENKWFVSFSSGPFVGIGKGIRNETYQWQAQPDGTGVISQNSQYKLVETDQKNYPVGFAAFANIGTKLTRGFGIAISPGVGVSIEDRPKPTYLIGPSFMFGEKQQLNISIGALFKKVEKFNPAAYPNLNTQFATKPSEVEYSSKFAPGGFLSISYTFFSYDRSKSVGSKSKK